jgi:hypothetical protein
LFALVFALIAGLSAQRASAEVYTLDINVLECSVDGTNLSLGELIPNCSVETGPGFFFAVSLNNGGGTLEAEASGGTASFAAGFGPGDWTMSETFPPQGYNAKRVWCSYFDANGATLLADNPMGDSGWTAYLYMAPDTSSVVCNWLHFNTGPVQTKGDVTVNKITCPGSFDAYNADIYDLAANCHEPAVVASFTLTDANGGQTTAQTPGSGLNTASFPQIVSGTLSIAEQAMDGYGTPRVFCKNSKLTGEEDPETEVAVSGTTVTTELKSGYDFLYCDWFNIPETQGVTIYINKHACPDGYYSTDPYDLAANCHESFDPISFEANGQLIGPSNQNPQTANPNGGAAQFQNLPADTWTVVEDLPDGYGEPVVFCKFINNTTNEDSAYQQVPVTNGNSIQQAIDPGYTLFCDWFNMRQSNYVGVYIHKYGCPDNWDKNWNLSQWQQYCTTIVRNVSFVLTKPDGSTDELPVNGIDVSWENLPTGTYGVKEQRPSTYQGSVVYCALGSYTASTGNYDKYDVQSDAISKALSDSEYLDCYWFNLPKPRQTGGNTPPPSGPATLIIVKYTCPESYDPLQRNANPARDCADTTDGVPFSVTGAQGAGATRKTGDDGDGTAKFGNLKAGSYLIAETYPQNVHEAFIWSCDSTIRTFDYPLTPFAHIGESGTVGIALVAGETVTCTWYDIPSPPASNPQNGNSGGAVDLSITVLECSGQAINPNSCDPADQGVEIDLEAQGAGSSTTLTTNANGIALGSVENGEYQLSTEASICFSQSDQFTADGTLDLSSVDASEVTLYLCDR